MCPVRYAAIRHCMLAVRLISQAYETPITQCLLASDMPPQAPITQGLLASDMPPQAYETPLHKVC